MSRRSRVPPDLAMLTDAELRRLDQLALDLLDLDSDQHRTFMTRLCAVDPIAAGRLKRILAWREPPPAFLIEPVLRSSPSGLALVPGALLEGRYRVQRRLGTGGMGEVWEAFDSTRNVLVAVKVLRPEVVGSGSARARFRKEFQLACRVESPHVCRVFDLHASGNSDFITMELLEGPALSKWLKKQRRVAPETAIGLLRQLAAGLGAAHSAGIVHRDLKPGNIHLCPAPGGATRLVVTDFGLARLTVPSPSVASSFTGSGNLIGTAAYMAPELFNGQRASYASDMYALGVILFEMITGHRPFEGASHNPFLPALRSLTEDPPSPSTLVPGLAEEWDRAVLRCLSRDPNRRPETPAELLRMLTMAR